MQRRFWKASRKEGFSATVSARAFISFAASLVSFAQRGTRPQRRLSRCRTPLSGWRRTTRLSCVGATFQLAAWFGVGFWVSK
jgi:hypothetical protein